MTIPTPAATLESQVNRLTTDFATALLTAFREHFTRLVNGSSTEAATVAQVRTPAKRRGRVWPKCPVCGKNAYPRGKGYCFKHAKKAKAKRAR